MIGLAATALLYGGRHGIDWDHIAAITDLTSGQRPRRGLLLATAYAAGHGAVVFILGVAAILGSDFIPAGLDEAMGRMVGATLVALGVTILVGLARDRRNFRLRSRWMYLAEGRARLRRWTRSRVVEIEHDHPHEHHGTHGHRHSDDDATGTSSVAAGGPVEDRAFHTSTEHRHRHTHRATLPEDPFGPGSAGAFGIGILHGVGAETPTQVIVFLTAARVAGGAAGVALLACFILGIIASNTIVASIAAAGYLNAERHFGIYAAVAGVNAAASLVVGSVFLAGGTPPTLIGG